jgi:hypothetical protein
VVNQIGFLDAASTLPVGARRWPRLNLALSFGGFLSWLCWCAGNRTQFGAACGPLLALIVTGFAIASSGFGIWQSWWMASLWLTAILTAAIIPAPHAEEHR